jgi:molecular chaperone DnaK
MTTTIDFGIDLGTTNSCVARWDSEAGAIRVFQNNDQMNVTPSAVHILKTGRVIVGRRASSALVTDPDNVAVEFKRWMGQKDRIAFPAAGREMSAEELSAEILKSLKEDVRRQTGYDMRSAVITVPAAFGALQCEATARAATLAGLVEAPLLQEPIAAAIGYQANPGDPSQRWLVFDLGGGTLDIAVVSTRDGRLNVLEHRGNNILGGKDIDKAILDQILLPALRSSFDLPESSVSDPRLRGLMARLRAKAEEAKIDLSTASDVTISLYDIGDDRSGTPIEMDVSISRAQLDVISEPLLEKCCQLAEEALAGARVSGEDLDKILLVGGPSQSPFLREMLQARIGAKIDFSADPMTVVGRGAATYASTLESKGAPATASRPSGPASAKAVSLKLAFEPVSAELECPVSGRVINGAADVEIKIEAEGGIWTSGWITPVKGFFDVPVMLSEGGVTTFWIYVRDGQGNLIEADIDEFKIRHGLVPSSPPLPHPIAVEVVGATGKAALDLIFPKGTPLPAERTVKYRAVRTLSPTDPNSALAVKLWEGEFLDAPEANEWVGNILIAPSEVKRSVPQGTEIEVTVRISDSRLITVDAFIAHLNQHFSGTIYVAQREEQDYSDLATNVSNNIPSYRHQIDQLEEVAAESADETLAEELQSLRRDLQELQELDTAAHGDRHAGDRVDPDNARRIVQDAKTLHGRISRVENRLSEPGRARNITQFVDLVEAVQEVSEKFGTNLEKQQCALLKRELERAAAKGDARTVDRATQELDRLRWRILSRYDWFWRDIFLSLANDASSFVDPAGASKLFERGHKAIANDDGADLRVVVYALWELQPKSKADANRDSAMLAGLRK